MCEKNFKRFTNFVVLFVIFVKFVEGDNTKFFTLTLEEKLKLDEFRDRISPILQHDYMKKEIYLIRFLRQTNFDVHAAERLMENMLKWREENEIDKLLDEEFPEFDQEYNVYLEGCDPLNRPVLSVPLGDWDIRRAILAGLGNRLMRYMDKIYEDSTTFLRNANSAGMEIVQATIIMDMSGFHAITHTCPRCLQLYLYFLGNLQSHYPGLIEKMYFVNTPEIIHVLWNLYEGVFTPKLREITTMFGRNKEQWQARLRDEIGADQLSKRYGGDKPDALEFYYIRLAGQLISTPEQLQSVNMTNVCSKDVKIYENLIREVHHEPGSRKGKNFEEWGCKRKQKV
ncbi:SEC14 cytosolic factor isoform X2 [Folsomia candida]|uniref:SEC14 cytosolic factor isoform X2 n=1 Tax=Folsomia candida TaxID=158441 RepID=UPI000B8FD4CC|nr:SEC14 cytosolic factor isoform X2 [Folsomia candida]